MPVAHRFGRHGLRPPSWIVAAVPAMLSGMANVGPPGPAPGRKPRRGDLLQADFEHLDRRGLGLGRARHETGVYRVATRGALPGSRAVVDVGRRRGERLEARVHELLDPGPFAVAPRCVHAGTCGGCAFQGLEYGRQLVELRRLVEEALTAGPVGRRALAAGVEVEPVIGAEEPWHYRNKMDFTFASRRWVEPHEPEGAEADFALGLHVAGRHEKVLDLRECHIAFRGAAEILASVRELAREQGLTPWDLRRHEGLLRHLVLRRAEASGEVLVDLVTSAEAPREMARLCATLLERHPEITTIVQDVSTRAASVALGELERVLHGPGVIRETLAGVTFEVSARSFFQTNTRQAERLVEVVREEAGLTGREVLVDLYCGAGTLGLTLARSVRELVGYESVPSAVADARRNAERNGIAHARFVEGDVLEAVRAADPTLARADVCVVDPPRAGLHPKVARHVGTLPAPRLVYVSCNVQAAARDLEALAEGGYELRRVRALDLFPHTPHVECVLTLERPPGSRPSAP